MRLDIGKVGTKQRLGTIDCELLNHIHMLAPAVIALAGIALGVLVGEQRTGRFEDAGAGMILGGDELDMIFLALRLGRNRLRELGVEPRNAHVLTKHRLILISTNGGMLGLADSGVGISVATGGARALSCQLLRALHYFALARETQS